MCFSDDTLPDGYSVNKGDTVAYQPYAMGRMKFIWGDDAEEYRPERWLDENNIFKPESPFKFIAFQVRFVFPNVTLILLNHWDKLSYHEGSVCLRSFLSFSLQIPQCNLFK